MDAAFVHFGTVDQRSAEPSSNPVTPHSVAKNLAVSSIPALWSAIHFSLGLVNPLSITLLGSYSSILASPRHSRRHLHTMTSPVLHAVTP